jgi:hypothetical protein
MSPAYAAVLVLLAALCGLAYLLGLSMSRRGEPFRDWLSSRTRHRFAGRRPPGRTIEAIAADARRLGGRYHGLDPHASFTKVEAVRGAYDHALTECCTALGLTHLLEVLPAGPELDAERARVEEQLSVSGVRLPHVA